MKDHVRLRCGHCRRELDRVEWWQTGPRLNGPDASRSKRSPAARYAVIETVTLDGCVYRCKCHKRHQVSFDAVCAAAERARVQGLDLFAGLRGYGIPA